MSQKTKIILSVIITVFIAGGVIYVWQNSNSESTEESLEIADSNTAFFIRENDNYVLYTKAVDKKEKKAGLMIPVQKRESDGEWVEIPNTFSAVISPDGNKVAYIGQKRPEDLASYLFIADINGSNQKVLATPGAYGHGAIGNDFFWDSSSQNIVYADLLGDEGGISYNIYSINVATGEKTEITSDSSRWDPNDPSQFRNVEIVPAGYFKN